VLAARFLRADAFLPRHRRPHLFEARAFDHAGADAVDVDVVRAEFERRRIASFPAYFDTTWKAGVQLAMSLGFTGAFWILLLLGAALFKVIGLSFLEDLLRETWFAIPVTFLVFAVAVHLTDVRDGLIRGVRTVALMLLSWLLLVMTVLAAGFLAALPFTGLQALWETGNATSLVLAAAAALIILSASFGLVLLRAYLSAVSTKYSGSHVFTCAIPILLFGSTQQKHRYLPKMARGELVGCHGITEPEAGSDPGAMRTTATREDGHWVIRGAALERMGVVR
jgi:hypothetical protein